MKKFYSLFVILISLILFTSCQCWFQSVFGGMCDYTISDEQLNEYINRKIPLELDWMTFKFKISKFQVFMTEGSDKIQFDAKIEGLNLKTNFIGKAGIKYDGVSHIMSLSNIEIIKADFTDIPNIMGFKEQITEFLLKLFGDINIYKIEDYKLCKQVRDVFISDGKMHIKLKK